MSIPNSNRGSRARFIESGVGSTTPLETMCACRISEVSDNLSNVVYLSGESGERAGRVDRGERRTNEQEPVSSSSQIREVAGNLTRIIDTCAVSRSLC